MDRDLVDVAWTGFRVVTGLYLVGLGAYAAASRRLPRRSRRTFWPARRPAGEALLEGRAAVAAGLACAAAGALLLWFGGR
jgi:hypothetical protein